MRQSLDKLKCWKMNIVYRFPNRGIRASTRGRTRVLCKGRTGAKGAGAHPLIVCVTIDLDDRLTVSSMHKGWRTTHRIFYPGFHLLGKNEISDCVIQQSYRVFNSDVRASSTDFKDVYLEYKKSTYSRCLLLIYLLCRTHRLCKTVDFIIRNTAFSTFQTTYHGLVVQREQTLYRRINSTHLVISPTSSYIDRNRFNYRIFLQRCPSPV